jgi:hypothetical protein
MLLQINNIKEIIRMCGGREKPCATCAFGGGGCLTSMYEDNYSPASITQVEKRLQNNEFPNYKELMQKYIAYKKAENDYKGSACINELWKPKE